MRSLSPIALVLILILAALGAGLLLPHLDRLAAETDREMIVTSGNQLTDEVVSLAHHFNRLQWFTKVSDALLRNCRARRLPVEKTAQLLRKRFPAAEIYVFGPDGRELGAGSEPGRRVSPASGWRFREKIWNPLLFYARNTNGEKGEWKSQEVEKLFMLRFGEVVNPTDFADLTGKPRIILDKAVPKVSWVIPAERCGSLPPRKPARGVSGQRPSFGKSGIWLLMDLKKIQISELAGTVFREKSPVVDSLVLVNRKAGVIAMEAKSGMPPPGDGAIRHLLKTGRGGFDSQGNLWTAFYLPGERGRYLLGGTRQDRLRCAWTKNRQSLVIALGLALIMGAAWGIGLIDPFGGVVGSLGGLRLKILALFFLTSIVPLGAIWKFGLERIADTERLARGRWEERMKAALGNIDAAYLGFQASQTRALKRIESQIADDVQAAGDSAELLGRLEKRLADFPKGDFLLLDVFGRTTRLVNGEEQDSFNGPHSEASHFLKRFFARKISREGGIPPVEFEKAPILIQGPLLETFLILLEEAVNTWQRGITGRRQRINRMAFLRRDDEPGRTLGVIGYALWEEDFARAFIRDAIRPMGDIRLVAVDEEDNRFPDIKGFPLAFRNLLERARLFRTWEMGEMSIGGRPSLVMAWSPNNLGGFRLVGILDARRIYEDSRVIRAVMWFATAAGLAYLVLAAQLLSSRYLARIDLMRRFVDRIGAGKFDSRIAVDGTDELAQTAVTFNEIAAGLQRRERLRRFVSDQVWDETAKTGEESLALGGKRREAAVIFSHLHEFDLWAGSLPAPELIGLLNDYFTRMDDAVRIQGGSIDKLVGDAVMAVFFPVPGAAHPAVRAALAAEIMLAETITLNGERWAACGPGSLSPGPLPAEPPRSPKLTAQHGNPHPGLPDGRVLRTDVGIHCGMVLSGKIGARTGRLDFTVIGDVVNTAARLVGTAASLPEASIVTSTEAYRALPSTTQAELLTGLRLKGKTQAINVYRIIEIPVA